MWVVLVVRHVCVRVVMMCDMHGGGGVQHAGGGGVRYACMYAGGGDVQRACMRVVVVCDMHACMRVVAMVCDMHVCGCATYACDDSCAHHPPNLISHTNLCQTPRKCLDPHSLLSTAPGTGNGASPLARSQAYRSRWKNLLSSPASAASKLLCVAVKQ